MHLKLFLVILSFLLPVYVNAQEVPAVQDSANIDSIVINKPKKGSWAKRFLNFVDKILVEINNVDTNYVEPHQWKFTVMAQNQNMFEEYKVSDNNGGSITFSPGMRSKVGPFVGYSMVFLGYNLQFNNLYVGNLRKEIDLSIYSQMFGVDIAWRHNGDDFHIKEVSAGNNITIPIPAELQDNLFNYTAFKFDAYYIFNRKHHSHPAAYNQTTRQLRSSGSAIAGFGISTYHVAIDLDRVMKLVNSINPNLSQRFYQYEKMSSMRYKIYSLSGGYAYNWVFAKNWLAAASLSAALSYNNYESENKKAGSFFDNFYGKITPNVIARFGLVWNNNRIYAGMLGLVNSYNFKMDRFQTSNFYGTLNFYVGFNFGKKKQYRKAGTYFEF